jgi:subtilisin family serine protease
MNKLNSLWLISLPVILMACGGGGDLNSDNAPPPAPPTVASAEYVVVTGKDYTYQLDTTGTGLSFSIPSSLPSGVKKAEVNPTGVLTIQLNRGDSQSDDKIAVKVPLTVNVSNGAGSASATLTFAVYKAPDLSNDPLAAFQWHLNNIAQYVFSTVLPSKGFDLNVLPVWGQGITGKEVIVNVVDSGLEIAHPDLAGNVSKGDSVNFGGGNDPTNSNSTTGDHGTSVAGLISSEAGNGIGGKGVAYGAKIMGHNILRYQNFESNIAKSYGGNPTDTSAKAAVFNASYGVPDCLFINKSIENTAYDNVKTLRGGKGGLIVKSAGNGFGNS